MCTWNLAHAEPVKFTLMAGKVLHTHFHQDCNKNTCISNAKANEAALLCTKLMCMPEPQYVSKVIVGRGTTCTLDLYNNTGSSLQIEGAVTYRVPR